MSECDFDGKVRLPILQHFHVQVVPSSNLHIGILVMSKLLLILSENSGYHRIIKLESSVDVAATLLGCGVDKHLSPPVCRRENWADAPVEGHSSIHFVLERIAHCTDKRASSASGGNRFRRFLECHLDVILKAVKGVVQR